MIQNRSSTHPMAANSSRVPSKLQATTPIFLIPRLPSPGSGIMTPACHRGGAERHVSALPDPAPYEDDGRSADRWTLRQDHPEDGAGPGSSGWH